MGHLKLILLIVVFLLVIILAFQNHEAMSTRIQFRMNPIIAGEVTSPEVSLFQVTIIAFFIGVIAMGIYGITERFRLKKQLKALAKELEENHKELNSLRNLPITSNEVDSGQAPAGSGG
jgi:hypothetical protein